MTGTDLTRVKALRSPAISSRSIAWLNDLPGTKAVLYLRESRSHQRRNLPQQLSGLKREVEKRGFQIVKVFKDLGSGWQHNRIRFEQAILAAKEAGAVAVAESVDRFRRCWPLPDERVTPRLNIFELKQLMAEADGVQLATFLHPDASPKEVRAYQTTKRHAASNTANDTPEPDPRK